MPIARNLRSAIIRRMADPVRREKRRAKAEHARIKLGQAHQVLYFHQVDDPYSQLAVQALAALQARYHLQILPKIVAAPTPIAIHEQALWDAWAQRECDAIAPFYGLAFQPAQPDPSTVAYARKLLVTVTDAARFTDLAQKANTALQNSSLPTLQGISGHGPLPSDAQTEQILQANAGLRHRLGHYLGAMFYYAGEWYWGIDRLHYLERRLDALGARRADAPPGPCVSCKRSSAPVITGTSRLVLEFFPSLRSPYTHLSYDRVTALCQKYPVDLVVRPVLPMMMRGVKADRRKGQYIIQDTQREAERLGIPFGNVWDPIGKPILRAYSLFPWAQQQGKAMAYLQSYSQAVWAERVNAWSLNGLRKIVERAGLDWHSALPHLDKSDWQAEMDANVDAMLAAGSWGVPTLRISATATEPAFTVWGQDRIWLVEEEIIRRLSAAMAASHASAHAP